MKRENQALRLAKMMQNHTRHPMYELALPLVMVRSNKLKKLSVDDVLLVGFDALEFVLIDEDTICANMVLKQTGNMYGTKIVYLAKDAIRENESAKYKTLKLSFGTVQSKVLEVGRTIDVTHIDLEKVTLVLEGKNIAEGSLINVDQEIAIQIKKVYI